MPNNVTPALDPNWAWDVPAWTNQQHGSSATAGNNLEASFGPGTSAFGGGGASLDGYLGETVNYEGAVTNGSGGNFATNTFYGSLVFLAEGGVTTKFAVNQSTTGTTTHAYAMLVSVSPQAPTVGTVVASSADLTSSALSTGAAVSWAASTTLAPGYYYAGMAYTNSVSPQVWGVSPTNAAQHQLNSASTLYLPRTVSGAAVLTSSPTGTTITLAAATTVGIPWVVFY